MIHNSISPLLLLISTLKLIVLNSATILFQTAGLSSNFLKLNHDKTQIMLIGNETTVQKFKTNISSIKLHDKAFPYFQKILVFCLMRISLSKNILNQSLELPSIYFATIDMYVLILTSLLLKL